MSSFTLSARPRTFRATVVSVRVILVAAIVALLEVLTRDGSISPLVLPPLSNIAVEVWGTLGTSQFYQDLARTALEVGASSAIGVSCGLVIGVVFWRIRVVGQALEPYASTFYALPTVVFYPILLALMGLGVGPIVVLASIMVTVPVALNTMTGLTGVSPILWKLARSIDCSMLQLYTKVLFPAALPVVAPGIQIGATYAVVGTVVMEFILADRGLGYRIGYEYNSFNILSMWSNIVVVVAFALVLIRLLNAATQRVRRETV